MKFLFSLFALVLITESCNSTKDAVSAKEETSNDSKSSNSMVDDNDTTSEYDLTSDITYTAFSRGTYDYVNVSEAKVSVSQDRNLKEMTTYDCDKSDWKELKKLMDEVNIKNLNKLKAPTEKRLYDGAAHATIALRSGDMIVTSSSFDHGHPPKEIEDLVNKVLSIKKSVTKD